MSERNDIRRQIAALEDELDRRDGKTSRKANDSDPLVDAFRKLENAVKVACGESFMDDEFVEEDIEEVPVMDDIDEMSYMDDGSDMDFMAGDAEDDITQDSLDDVLEEEKNPASIVTEPSMLDTAPTGYVARLKSASQRLDKVAEELEKQGNKNMAKRIDTIADAVDARIQQEASDA